jgi:hypothetical protein
MTVAQATTSLQQVLTNILTFCDIDSVSPRRWRFRLRGLLVFAPAIVSSIDWSTTAFGNDASPPSSNGSAPERNRS